MALHSRRLTVLGPCAERGLTRVAPDRLWCERCTKPVHDLSAMTEREARRLLDRHAGGSICVSYRRREDGTIATMPEPSRRRLLAATVVLSACAGHPERGGVEVPDDCVEEGCERGAVPARGGQVVAEADAAAPTGGSQSVRVDFSVDPDVRLFLGAVGVAGRSDRLPFKPTREILAELRARWRERARQRALARG